MQQTDFARFRAVMAGISELFQRELSKPLLDAYWLALASWTLAEFEQAAQHLMGTSTFMPRPVDFNALRKAGRPTSAEAWLTARGSLRWTINGYVEADGVDPLVSQALRAIGGANVLAMCDDDKLTFLERRFHEAYEALQDSTDTRKAVPQIAMWPARGALGTTPNLALPDKRMPT